MSTYINDTMKFKVIFLLNCESSKYIAKLFSLSIYVGSDQFWGFKIFNFNNVWVFRKNEYFLGGMKELWILQYKNWTIWCVCAGGGISILG